MHANFQMTRDLFISSRELKLNLLSIEKKLMRRDKYVIEVITDMKIDQVKKTYRQFQYFNKIINDRALAKDISLNRSIRSSNRNKSLQQYIEKLNSGILLYRNLKTTEETSHSNAKTRQIRSNLFTLLYQPDAMFVDGVDQSSDEETSFKKEEPPVIHRTKSNEIIQKVDKSNELKSKKEKQREKSDLMKKDKQKAMVLLKKDELKKDIQESYHNISKNFMSLLRSKKKASFELSQNASIKTILKNIKQCYLKCPNNFKNRDKSKFFVTHRWVLYSIKTNERSVEFANSEHRRVLLLYSFDVELSFQDYTKIILRNKIDKNPLEIRLDIQSQENQQIYQKYLALYTYLKQLSNKLSGSKVLNKIRLRLTLKKNHKESISTSTGPSLMHGSELNKNSVVKQINIKLNHGQIQGGQRNSVVGLFNLGFEQFVDVDVPIIDNYGLIEMFFNEVKQDTGFLNNIGLMDSYSMLKIPVQTVYDYVYNQNKPQKKHVEAKNKIIELKNTRATLQIQYKGIGSYNTYCSYHESDIFQGDEKPAEFSRDQFRMHMNRLKRIIWTCQQYSDWIKDLKNFTYPNASIVFYILLFVFTLLYDNNYMHIMIIVSLLLVLIYNSPGFSIYFPQLITILDYRQRYTKISVWLGKKNEKIEHEYSSNFGKLVKKAFLDEFELTRKKKRNIYKKYKRLAEILLRCQNLALFIVSIIEKTKNVFIWYHYEKTKLLCLGLLGLLLLFVCIPFRLIAIFLLFKSIKKGLKYHSRIQDINCIVLTQIIRIIIQQNQFNVVKQYLNSPQKLFDYENIQTRQFFEKCSSTFLEWLDIYYDEKEVLQNSRNMEQFIKNLSKCKTQFLIKQEICKRYKFSLEWSKNDKSAARLMKLVYGFIITIPSDKMIMGVKTVAEEEQDKEKEEDGHGHGRVGQFLDF